MGDSSIYTNASNGGTWSVLDPSIFKVNIQGKITALKQGSTNLNYAYTVNGCTAVATKSIIVNSLPTVKANATSLELCKGSTVTLSGSGATTYSWDNGVTDGLAFTPTNTKEYKVIGTDDNGCQQVDSVRKSLVIIEKTKVYIAHDRSISYLLLCIDKAF